jgi:hypothetical protein
MNAIALTGKFRRGEVKGRLYRSWFVADRVVRFRGLARPRESSVKSLLSRLTRRRFNSKFTFMDNPDFDQLLRSYKQAVDRWVDAIHAEESLATADHSMVQMEKWDDAGFALHDAELTAKKARDAYKNALRKKNYGI